MKRVLTILMAIVFISAMAISANAADSGKSYAEGHGKFDFAKKLNLSKNQLEKMKDLHSRFQNETRDLRYDLAIKRIEMRKLFTDPKTDDAALLAKQKELSSLREQLSEKRAQMKIEWRKILTPEQIAKLDRMPHRWGARGRGMKGHDMHRHGFDS
jgi:zinc resistance-associated protein